MNNSRAVKPSQCLHIGMLPVGVLCVTATRRTVELKNVQQKSFKPGSILSPEVVRKGHKMITCQIH